MEIKEILNLKEYKETKDWYHYGYGAMYLISVGYLLYTRAGTLKLRDLNEYFDQNTINQIEIQATKLTTKDNNQNATKMTKTMKKNLKKNGMTNEQIANIKQNSQGKWTYKGKETGIDYGQFDKGYEDDVEMRPLNSKRIESPPSYAEVEKFNGPTAPMADFNNGTTWEHQQQQMDVIWKGSTMYVLNKKTNQWEES